MTEEDDIDEQDEPRPHHHFFAHRLHRNLVAHDPQRYFEFMQQDDLRASVIDKLWRHCDEVLGEEFGCRTFDVAETSSWASRIGPFPTIGVRMPAAERPAEAIWVLAVLMVPTAAVEPPPQQPGHRYFTAEWSHDGIAVCEWTADGTHHTYGFVGSEEDARRLIEQLLRIGAPERPQSRSRLPPNRMIKCAGHWRETRHAVVVTAGAPAGERGPDIARLPTSWRRPGNPFPGDA